MFGVALALSIQDWISMQTMCSMVYYCLFVASRISFLAIGILHRHFSIRTVSIPHPRSEELLNLSSFYSTEFVQREMILRGQQLHILRHFLSETQEGLLEPKRKVSEANTARTNDRLKGRRGNSDIKDQRLKNLRDKYASANYSHISI